LREGAGKEYITEVEQQGREAIPACSRSHERNSPVLKPTHKQNTLIFSLALT